MDYAQVIKELSGTHFPTAKKIVLVQDNLTSREREVLGLICEGLSDTRIAERLGLKRNTVRNHVSTIYGKIDVHSRSGAVVWARQRGFTGKKADGADRTKARRKT